jgi:hypothetical protein
LVNIDPFALFLIGIKRNCSHPAIFSPIIQVGQTELTYGCWLQSAFSRSTARFLGISFSYLSNEQNMRACVALFCKENKQQTYLSKKRATNLKE